MIKGNSNNVRSLNQHFRSFSKISYTKKINIALKGWE
jgi:hypothetical protein